jgi:hypothetical protein
MEIDRHHNLSSKPIQDRLTSAHKSSIEAKKNHTQSMNATKQQRENRQVG